jgi:predicted polyphosphate/ATP-dependent NAD kinase
MAKPLVGLVVNPVAGMGGRVGLKGTDGTEMLEEALRRGAEPVAPDCVLRFLDRLGKRVEEVTWLTCTGDMGADILREGGLHEVTDYKVVFTPRAQESTGPEDTRRACQMLVKEGAELILFCGGDGTARNVLEAIGNDRPVLGIPAGVKMFSGTFALSPEAAGDVLAAHLDDDGEIGGGEVVDVDEEAYRRGELAVSLYGTMPILRARSLVQSPKWVSSLPDEGAMQRAIARYVVELLEKEGHPLTLLGAGTTVEAVAEMLGVPKTPLGVDVVRDGQVIVADGSEEDLLRALSDAEGARVVLSPIGAQGFVLGRGSQQISPEVLEAAGGPASLMIVATPHKVKGLSALRVDTGDPELDGRLAGMRRVIVGYHDVSMLRMEAASSPSPLGPTP